MLNLETASRHIYRATFLALTLAACQSAGYMSSVSLEGAQTRAGLSASVLRTIDAQETCLMEFVEAEALREALQDADTDARGRAFQALRNQVDRCARSMETFGQRNAATLAEASELFAAWDRELAQFSSESLQAHSALRLDESIAAFELLQEELAAVREQQVAVLEVHRDALLYFNHNAGASAAPAVEAELRELHVQMMRLAGSCATVRKEAAGFVGRLEGAPGPSSSNARAPWSAAERSRPLHASQRRGFGPRLR